MPPKFLTVFSIAFVKRSVSVFLIVIIFYQTFLCAELKAEPQYLGTKTAAFLVDVNSGQVLHDDLGNELRHPASLTKMMTLYLLFDKIKSKKFSLASLLLVSEKAASVAPSKLGLKPGSQIKVEDAIKALVVKSANDMAVAVAENISGNEVIFARLMSQTAKKIGMEKTVFRNASGLPNRGQVTTAKDMVILALRLQNDFPEFYHYFSLKSFTYDGKTFETHNKLLIDFDGIDGIKTGYTRMSGFNIVSSLNIKEKKIVGAVFGGISAEARDAHMRMLLALAIQKASNQRHEILNWARDIDVKSEQVINSDNSNSSISSKNTKIKLNTQLSSAKENDNLSSVTPNFNTSTKRAALPKNHAIQIGVFQNLESAELALSSAQRHLGVVLSNHASQTLPLKKDGKFLYIALFSDFELDSAVNVCKELRRLKIDCIPVKEP